jgi:inner membrane protein
MDTLTHALSGALLGRATAGSKSDVSHGRRMAVGAIAAAFPDIDIVASFASPLTYLVNHRGPTHSVFLLPLWAWVLAALAALLWRHPRGWRAYYGMAFMGIAAHILGDLITSYGTIVFAPLSQARYSWDTTFIIDLWFSGIVAAGLVASGFWRGSRLPATVSLAVLVGYVGFQAVMRNEAKEFAEQYATERGIPAAQVSAHPGAVSPFNWAVYVRSRKDDATYYDYTYINLITRTPRPEPGADAGFIERLSSPFQPRSHAAWRTASLLGDAGTRRLANEAWTQPSLGFFRWFAEFPALYRVDSGNPSECVWFYDLRFARPGTDRLPFRYGLCRENGRSWERYQLVSDTEKVPFN